MPSVMQTTRGTSASTASMMAPTALGGGHGDEGGFGTGFLDAFGNSAEDGESEMHS